MDTPYSHHWLTKISVSILKSKSYPIKTVEDILTVYNVHKKRMEEKRKRLIIRNIKRLNLIKIRASIY